jgi:hypothetical protein
MYRNEWLCQQDETLPHLLQFVQPVFEHRLMHELPVLRNRQPLRRLTVVFLRLLMLLKMAYQISFATAT